MAGEDLFDERVEMFRRFGLSEAAARQAAIGRQRSEADARANLQEAFSGQDGTDTGAWRPPGRIGRWQNLRWMAGEAQRAGERQHVAGSAVPAAPTARPKASTTVTEAERAALNAAVAAVGEVCGLAPAEAWRRVTERLEEASLRTVEGRVAWLGAYTAALTGRSPADAR